MALFYLSYEHLNWYDDLITESYRILEKGGHLVIAFPNLANYIQRIALLLGYQPTDVCISRERYVGTLYCRGQKPVGHMRSATAGAMKGILEYYNFEVISITGADPTLKPYSKMFHMIGKIMPTNLSRRLIVVARK